MDFNFNDQNDLLRESLEHVAESKRRREELQDEANKTAIESKEILLEIAENTAYLKKLVEINRETKLNTEELSYVMRAIYDVAKANNKDEADSLFKKALDTINGSGEIAGNIVNLISLLTGIYTVVNTIN
ncbi:hypothetical protein EY675_08455 [Enterococcus casseliflavus]|uniref:hypothetical protein n=1 Tax=Enterococcus casseliflavus TaxID=37734 RepID=UPI001AD692B5|nr:hypothetical protein [Enterococcus casseliflavus]MBO6385575.1 hypothetical protein [Enterococcus casseliflavus]